ncbi:hypothetical protein [Rhizobium sp. G21]|uniref:hypothetical protein n=1 Tax=Rhizobium sp. G21 TaxID=2758439 RepID=UPI0015FF3EED|nr:hypothetical protein [Rhizobium sp. G21]MBB1249217.1 hypothetical protein [Rhizobium sp. G21]
MIDTKEKTRLIAPGALGQALSRAAAWLIETEDQAKDPFLDPVFLHMSARELADLPFTRWPDQKETSPTRAPERLKKMPERTASPAPGLPKEGVDVQQAKRCASAP